MSNVMEPPPSPPPTPPPAVYVRKRKRSSTADQHPPSSSTSKCSTPTKVCLKKNPISASPVEGVDNRGSHYCPTSNINFSSLLTAKNDMVYNGEPLSLQFEPVTPRKRMNKGLQKKQQQQAEIPIYVFRWPRACHNKKWTDNKYARDGALSSAKRRGPLQNGKSNKKGKNVQVHDTMPVPIRKRPQPKAKICNLLMEGANKEKWWEEQRIYHGQVGSFISCMRRIQGVRRFIPWKGSVVDSVIGAFLTQNVSDNLSSSAFISLAARFPLHSTSGNRAQYKEEINRFVVETEVGIEKLSIETRIRRGHTNLQTTEGKGSCSGSNSEAKYLMSRCQSTNSDKGFSETTAMDTSKVKKVKVEKAKVKKLKGKKSKVNQVKVEKAKVKKLKGKKAKVNPGKVRKADFGDWECLRKQAVCGKATKEEGSTDMEGSSLDHEALRCAKVGEIADAIMGRGQHNHLAQRIKAFLNQTVKNHGSIDLEWLKDILPDKAKEYLMSIFGLGLKSVECIRLLTLHQAAFPVDTNVGRIAVRLGWVPLEPRSEDDLLHLLKSYPVQKSIHEYIWPMLCKLDQATLYELHYQMITFGKVFCTKKNPNCNACPMNAECKYYASELASKRPTLPGTQEKAVVPPKLPIVAYPHPVGETSLVTGTRSRTTGCEPVTEEPATPKNRCMELVVPDIEDAFYDEEPDEIPTISPNFENAFYDEETDEIPTISPNFEKLLPDDNMSNALVTLTPEAASASMSKLKNATRLRTEHYVYELTNGHPLLDGLDERLPDDPCPYLLAIWAPGETEESTQPSERCGSWLESGILCKEGRCLSCSSIRKRNSEIVPGTLLVPVKTTMRGRFPLNGTYFQVNEVFADHGSSIRPISVPRALTQNLRKRIIYFGTSVNSIYKGLSKEEIQLSFNEGYICVRGFDREKRLPRPLDAVWRARNNQKQRVNEG